ncbi:hypothetical protein LEP1GSC170_5982 [Leptospira interrogans serovar Bataviae str. HAI135]|nr:hypothetical protein LEP1GSC170_5982 [Leptospira interrogans serovar Bataviae str. HAI135]
MSKLDDLIHKIDLIHFRNFKIEFFSDKLKQREFFFKSSDSMMEIQKDSSESESFEKIDLISF